MNRTRAQIMAHAKRFSKETQEDFAQYVDLKQLEGRESTLEFLLIDFLRNQNGHPTRNPNRYQDRQAYLYDEEVHAYPSQDDLTGIDYHALMQSLDQKEKAYINLIHRWGMTMKEAGEVFGVNESRASQIVSEIHAKLKRQVMNPHLAYKRVQGTV